MIVKIAIGIASVLLLCGGFFCFCLTAQTGGANNAGSFTKPVSLLDPKIGEASEREKLLDVVKTKIDALTEYLRATMVAYELDVSTIEVVLTAEIRLLDALLEQKRFLAEQQ